MCKGLKVSIRQGIRDKESSFTNQQVPLLKTSSLKEKEKKRKRIAFSHTSFIRKEIKNLVINSNKELSTLQN